MFLATVIRSAFGFGEALIAVPLLALVLPVEVAAPVAVLVSITVAAVVVAQDWREVHFGSAGWLVLSTLFGIPVGLLILKTVPEVVVKAILGIVIASFSAYSLARRHRFIILPNDRLAWLFGFVAGILERRVWDERSSAGGLRRHAGLVAGQFPRDLAGLLPTRQPGGNDRVLVRRPVDSGRQPVLPDLVADRLAGHLPRTVDQPAGYTPDGFWLYVHARR